MADLQENGLNNLMLAEDMESDSENEENVLSDDTKEQKAVPKTPVKIELQVRHQLFIIWDWQTFLEKDRAISKA